MFGFSFFSLRLQSKLYFYLHILVKFSLQRCEYLQWGHWVSTCLSTALSFWLNPAQENQGVSCSPFLTSQNMRGALGSPLLLDLKASPWVPEVDLFHVIPVVLLLREQQSREPMAAKLQGSGSSCSLVLITLLCVFWLKVPVLLRAHSPTGINPRIPEFRQGKYFNVIELGWRCLPQLKL